MLSYPLQMVCSPVQVGRGESGLLPDRTQGAGLSRRLAGEVYGLALNPAASVMKGSNILQRTGIIGSNPIIAVVLLFIIRFSIAIRWESMGHTGRKQNPH